MSEVLEPAGESDAEEEAPTSWRDEWEKLEDERKMLRKRADAANETLTRITLR